MADAKRIYKGQLTAAGGLLYTAPTTGGTLIKGIRVINTDTVARWFRYGTAGTTDADLLIAQFTLPAGDTWFDDDLVILASGQVIHGRAEVDSKLTTHIFGFEL